MIYLLWFILNLIIALGALYVCYLAVMQVAIKYGRIVAFVFAICMMSIICKPANNDSPGDEKWKFQADSGSVYRTYHIDKIVKQTPLFSINMGASYIRREKNGRIYPLESYAYTNGVTAGTKFKPTSIVLNGTETTMVYDISGTTEWSLLGIKLYMQAEQFTGFIPLH